MNCSLCTVAIGRHTAPVPDGHGGEAHSKCVAKRTKERAASRLVERPDVRVGGMYLWPSAIGAKSAPHRRVTVLSWIGVRVLVRLEDGTETRCDGGSLMPACSLCLVPIGATASPVPDGTGGEAHNSCIVERRRKYEAAKLAKKLPALVVGCTYLWPAPEGDKRIPHRRVEFLGFAESYAHVKLADGTTTKCAPGNLHPVPIDKPARRSLNQ